MGDRIVAAIPIWLLRPPQVVEVTVLERTPATCPR